MDIRVIKNDKHEELYVNEIARLKKMHYTEDSEIAEIIEVLDVLVDHYWDVNRGSSLDE